MTVHAFVQARLGSTRLPGKSMADIASKPALQRIVDRVRAAPGIDAVAVLTSDTPGDEPLRRFCAEHRIVCVAGSEDDVLARFAQGVRSLRPDAVVRITADCPLVDPGLLGQLVSLFEAEGRPDHVAIATGAMAAAPGLRRYPDGLDAEIVPAQRLLEADEHAADAFEREHVTPYLWRHPDRFRLALLEAPEDWGTERWTVDHAADLAFVRAVFDRLGERAFGFQDVLALLEREPALRAINRAERDGTIPVR